MKRKKRKIKRRKLAWLGLSILVMDYRARAGQQNNNIMSDQKQAVVTLTSFGTMLARNGKLLKKQTP